MEKPLSARGFSARNTSSGFSLKPSAALLLSSRVRRSRAPASSGSGFSAAEGPVLPGSRLQNNRVSSPRNTCRAASPPSRITLCSCAGHVRAARAAPLRALTSRGWPRRSRAQPRALRPLELREQAAGLLLAQHRGAGRRAPPRVLHPHAQQPLCFPSPWRWCATWTPANSFALILSLLRMVATGATDSPRVLQIPLSFSPAPRAAAPQTSPAGRWPCGPTWHSGAGAHAAASPGRASGPHRSLQHILLPPCARRFQDRCRPCPDLLQNGWRHLRVLSAHGIRENRQRSPARVSL